MTIPAESVVPEPISTDSVHCWGLPIGADWRTAYWLHYRSQPLLKRAFQPALLVSLSAWILWRLQGSPLSYALGLGTPLLIITLRMIRVRMAIRQIQAKAQRIGGSPEWIFEPSRLISIWGANRSEQQWSVFDKVSVNDEMILVQPTSRIFYCIPTRFLKNPDDAAKIIGFAAAAHVPVCDFRKGTR